MQRNNYVPADRPIGLVLGDEKFAKCGTEILPIDIAVKGSRQREVAYLPVAECLRCVPRLPYMLGRPETRPDRPRCYGAGGYRVFRTKQLIVLEVRRS